MIAEKLSKTVVERAASVFLLLCRKRDGEAGSSGRFGTTPPLALGLRPELRSFLETGAAVLFDEGQCFVDHVEAGRAAHDAALPYLHDQPGRDKATQVEGERGGGGA